MKTLLRWLVAYVLVSPVPLWATELPFLLSTRDPGRDRSPWFAEVQTQFTPSDTLQKSGNEVSNPRGERLDNSITALSLGAFLTKSTSLELNAPFVHREYRRVTGDGVEDGRTAGFGDLSLTGRWNVIDWRGDGARLTWELFGGVKFPTGDADRLESDGERPPPRVITSVSKGKRIAVPVYVYLGRIKPGSGVVEFIPIVRGSRTVVLPDRVRTKTVETEKSGVHPHDLALGSGSFDFPLGMTLSGSHGRVFVTAEATYVVRTEGDFDYRYGNDFLVSGGPGIVFFERGKASAALQFLIAAEHHQQDRMGGRTVEDSGRQTVYLGAQLSVGWGDRVAAAISFETPVQNENHGLQTVPDHRLTASLNLRF